MQQLFEKPEEVVTGPLTGLDRADDTAHYSYFETITMSRTAPKRRAQWQLHVPEHAPVTALYRTNVKTIAISESTLVVIVVAQAMTLRTGPFT